MPLLSDVLPIPTYVGRIGMDTHSKPPPGVATEALQRVSEAHLEVELTQVFE